MTLINTVAFGALGLSGIGLLTQYLRRRNIRNSWCYQEAVKSLHDHPEAQKQLGQPIVEGYIDLGDTVGNNRDEKRIWYSVPVKGHKSSGKMTYYVREDSSSDREYKVSRVELALDHIKDKILLIKNEDSV